MEREAVGLIGSPRAESVSSRLLRAGLDALADAGWRVTVFDTPNEDVRPCPACGACAKTGECVVRDAMDRILPRLLSADAVLVGSPVYFYGLPAQLKAVVDRTQPVWQRRWRLEKDAHADAPARPCLVYLVAGGPETAKLWTGAELTLGVWANTLGLEQPAVLHKPQTDAAGALALTQWEAEAAAFARERLVQA
jgi:multimeric flavodoxin WrbA